MKIYYSATALFLQYVATSVTNAEDLLNTDEIWNATQELAEAAFDDDTFLDCVSDEVALRYSHPDLLAAEIDMATTADAVMNVDPKGKGYFVTLSYDESKKEVYRNECADIGNFFDIPTFQTVCSGKGGPLTFEIKNAASCAAKTDACESVTKSPDEVFAQGFEGAFEMFGADPPTCVGVASVENESAEIASGASTTFRGAVVASAFLVGVVFAA